jgi:hypothetical protein
MSNREDDIDRHTKKLVRLTTKAFNSKKPLPEDALARLGQEIALTRQLLIDEIYASFEEDEPDAARPGVAEFDAGFRYGLEFARAIDEARIVIERSRRRRILKLVRSDT